MPFDRLLPPFRPILLRLNACSDDWGAVGASFDRPLDVLTCFRFVFRLFELFFTAAVVLGGLGPRKIPFWPRKIRFNLRKEHRAVAELVEPVW